VPWEGGYVGTTYDTWDLLYDEVETPFTNEDLMNDVIGALPEHRWAQRDFYRLRPHVRLQLGWENFSQTVKHQRRFFFADYAEADDSTDPDFIDPGSMLVAIGDAIGRGGLVRELPADSTVWRVRPHLASESPATASELGATPVELIRASSRMSPAGIPLFCGALDEDTAIAEAQHANPDAEAYTLAAFQLLRPARIVDLAEPRGVPSLFDIESERQLRQPLIFLSRFSTAIAEPFVRDERIHIEYVPTQVVTEWTRTRFDPGDGRAVDAVAYRSARHSAGVNLAIFIDNSGACDPGAPRDRGVLLELRDHRRL
jgi:HEPN/RES N-terminal domain 1/RES domain